MIMVFINENRQKNISFSNDLFLVKGYRCEFESNITLFRRYTYNHPVTNSEIYEILGNIQKKKK